VIGNIDNLKVGTVERKKIPVRKQSNSIRRCLERPSHRNNDARSVWNYQTQGSMSTALARLHRPWEPPQLQSRTRTRLEGGENENRTDQDGHGCLSSKPQAFAHRPTAAGSGKTPSATVKATALPATTALPEGDQDVTSRLNVFKCPTAHVRARAQLPTTLLPGAGFTNFTKFLIRILLSFYHVAQAPRRTLVGLYQHIPTNSVGESGPWRTSLGSS
jgi:hypothetical protein